MVRNSRRKADREEGVARWQGRSRKSSPGFKAMVAAHLLFDILWNLGRHRLHRRPAIKACPLQDQQFRVCNASYDPHKFAKSHAMVSQLLSISLVPLVEIAAIVSRSGVTPSLVHSSSTNSSLNIPTSSSDGGSAVSARRIHNQLLANRINSQLFVSDNDNSEEKIFFFTTINFLRVLDKFFNYFLNKLGLQYFFVPSNFFLNKDLSKSSIIQL